jgi:hypothetical protein
LESSVEPSDSSQVVKSLRFQARVVTSSQKFWEVTAVKPALDKAKEDRNSAKAKPEDVATKAIDVFGTLLNPADHATWSRIMKKHTVDTPWTDHGGEEHDERCGKSWESLKDCIIKYLKTQFSGDAADVQRY